MVSDFMGMAVLEASVNIQHLYHPLYDPALFITANSYFFFWPFFGSIWFLLGYFGVFSWTGLLTFSAIYFAQIALYR